MTDRIETYSYPMGAHAPCPVGTFRVSFSSPKAQWSDGMFKIHGYLRGEIVPTMDLIIAHKHPEDRRPICELLGSLRAEGGRAAVFHRLIDSTGRNHRVLTVIDTISDDSGINTGFQGFMVDLTRSLAVQASKESAAAVTGAYATKAVIEQAKGMIMCSLLVGSDDAFKILAERSQRTNTKLPAVASALIEAAAIGKIRQVLDQWDTPPL
ncbi:PAS and ANTAR domain-containing protein [Paenarthrobacter ureafaciens]|uniref:PAS and ANTAR domain-containing protein n=2 Tax=Paenarthrobacter ureafaciens TaxID=37931 RepID=UPI000396163C|nr:hypothetical protein ARZXY2_4609 [Arthrobacter sp. ZXY-2]ERI37973.1 hypothetical protein M707_07945 [Arthrobacter sp. AK-YN10]GLU61059.1 hypothetical protein Pure01_35720 [Paenarthrobacter ureafaciens]GLU65328.1 hypothetical protein Pure02_35780 [Paenarthrobacter ureafaciens]GLU69715.1 hypothetical protein Pure03_36910 [Paenarthrobacter ureafaciens]